MKVFARPYVDRYCRKCGAYQPRNHLTCHKCLDAYKDSVKKDPILQSVKAYLNGSNAIELECIANPVDLIQREEDKHNILSLLDIGLFNDRTRKVVMYRSGIFEREHTFKEIGQIFGISGGRAAQIYNKATRRIRSHLTRKGLYDA